MNMQSTISKLEALHPHLDTPALVIIESQLTQNIEAMQQLANAAKVKLRPHVKTHRSTLIANRQIAAGAMGITVAKIGEAEVMAEAGISDIFIANQAPHPKKLERLQILHDKIDISIGIDHQQQAEMYSRFFNDPAHPLPVIIEIDSGMHRCGVNVGKDLKALAQRILGYKGLAIQGIFTHAGQAYAGGDQQAILQIALHEDKIAAQARQELVAQQIPVSVVSIGSTPTIRCATSHRQITEIRPGNYVFYDVIQRQLGSCQLEDCALFVMATVISQPSSKRIVIDAGSKALNLDRGVHTHQLLTGYGQTLNIAGRIDRLSEEHGVVILDSPHDVPVGSAAIIIPNHACVVANLYRQYFLLQEDGQLAPVKVDAQGKSQ